MDIAGKTDWAKIDLDTCTSQVNLDLCFVAENGLGTGKDLLYPSHGTLVFDLFLVQPIVGNQRVKYNCDWYDIFRQELSIHQAMSIVIQSMEEDGDIYQLLVTGQLEKFKLKFELEENKRDTVKFITNMISICASECHEAGDADGTSKAVKCLENCCVVLSKFADIDMRYLVSTWARTVIYTSQIQFVTEQTLTEIFVHGGPSSLVCLNELLDEGFLEKIQSLSWESRREIISRSIKVCESVDLDRFLS